MVANSPFPGCCQAPLFGRAGAVGNGFFTAILLALVTLSIAAVLAAGPATATTTGNGIQSARVARASVTISPSLGETAPSQITAVGSAHSSPCTSGHFAKSGSCCGTACCTSCAVALVPAVSKPERPSLMSRLLPIRDLMPLSSQRSTLFRPPRTIS